MVRHKLFFFFLLSFVFAAAGCGSDELPPLSPSCQEAIRIHKEITPDMQILARALELPEGDQKNQLYAEFAVSDAASRFYKEFCPAFTDCGSMPGYDQSITDMLVKLCNAVRPTATTTTTQIALPSEASCQEAVRIYEKIAPDVQKLEQVSELPTGEQKTKLIAELIQSDISGRLKDEFCPVFLDCGRIVGYDESVTDLSFKLCKVNRTAERMTPTPLIGPTRIGIVTPIVESKTQVVTYYFDKDTDLSVFNASGLSGVTTHLEHEMLVVTRLKPGGALIPISLTNGAENPPNRISGNVVLEGTTTAAGVSIHYKTGRAYVCDISRTPREYKCRLLMSEKWHDLLGGNLPLDIDLGKPVKLDLSEKDGLFSLFINDIEYGSFRDTRFGDGFAAIFVETSDTFVSKATFDNINVYLSSVNATK